MLRPHHGMCLAYFEGKGYSEGFTAHMQSMLERLLAADGTAGNAAAVGVIDGTAGNAAAMDVRDSTADADNARNVNQDENRGGKVPVRLVTRTDDICSACPNNEDGFCRDEEKVRDFDCGVLELCGLENGDILEFDEFISLVQRRILSVGRRTEICGGCQWESICANRKSRWELECKTPRE